MRSIFSVSSSIVYIFLCPEIPPTFQCDLRFSPHAMCSSQCFVYRCEIHLLSLFLTKGMWILLYTWWFQQRAFIVKYTGSLLGNNCSSSYSYSYYSYTQWLIQYCMRIRWYPDLLHFFCISFENLFNFFFGSPWNVFPNPDTPSQFSSPLLFSACIFSRFFLHPPSSLSQITIWVPKFSFQDHRFPHVQLVLVVFVVIVLFFCNSCFGNTSPGQTELALCSPKIN